MKKLMIVLAAIALAGVTQAASFQWKNGTSQYVYQAGTTTKASGTIYLFDSATISQAALLDAIIGEGKAITALTSLDNASLTTAGGFSKTSDFASIVGDQTLNAYVAIVDGDNVFVSALKAGVGQESSTTSLSFGGLSAASKAAASDWIVGGSAVSAGWYKAAVPEPTSGLLMLIGLGALALRRRRA